MRWCAVVALAAAGGLVVAAAGAAAPVPDATMAPGPPATTASGPVRTASLSSLIGVGETSDAPLEVPPVSPFTVVTPFDPPSAPWAAGHRGIDVAATPGQDVVAPGGGYVTFAGWVVDRGVVVIAHDGGLRSSFEPADATVTVGTRVLPGDVVARVSAVGGHCAATPCLHWGVRRQTTYVDPLDVLAGFGPIRLLPSSPRTRRS